MRVEVRLPGTSVDHEARHLIDAKASVRRTREHPYSNSLGLPSYQALPPGSAARDVAEILDTRFTGTRTDEFAVALPGVPAGPAVDDFARGVRSVGGVDSVRVQTSPASSWLSVVPSVVPRSPEGERMVHDIRALDAPFGFAVGGDAAELVDAKAAIASRLPLALAVIALTTAVLLLAAFGSLLVPAKAILANLLSLTATFGAMVWIFQDGNLSGLLGFTATGQLDVTMPILIFLKLMGIGLALAVLVDATVIRGLLVPAFMRLAGTANWWAVPPLRRLHRRWAPAV